MIDFLTYFFIFTVYGGAVACLTFFLYLCLDEGMIFHRYTRWLEQFPDHEWTKPLGMCPYCTNAWLAILLYPLLLWKFDLLKSWEAWTALAFVASFSVTLLAWLNANIREKIFLINDKREHLKIKQKLMGYDDSPDN